MAYQLTKLKEIIRTNIKNIKEVADAVVCIKEKLLATEETVAEILERVDKLEDRAVPTTSDGVRMFGVGGTQTPGHGVGSPELDIESSELGNIIAQHPSWLRPFTVQAELERHDLEVETLRLRRSLSGYIKVLRLTNGSEWAYLEEISFERFTRLTLLKEVFDVQGVQSAWKSAWIEKPIRLQSLQRGARWEILGKGLLITEG